MEIAFRRRRRSRLRLICHLLCLSMRAFAANMAYGVADYKLQTQFDVSQKEI